MWRRIFAVTENTLWEIHKKRGFVGLVLLVVLGLLGAYYIRHELISDKSELAAMSFQVYLVYITKWTLNFGLIISVLLSAGLVGTEIASRTMTAVMTRPIHRWEYLAGRILGVMLFFLIWIFAVIFWACVVAWMFNVSLSVWFFVSMGQTLLTAICLITIAASLGTFMGPRSVIILMAALPLFYNLVSSLSIKFETSQNLQDFLYFILPVSWPVDLIAENGISNLSYSPWMLGGVALDLLFYGVAVFLISTWIFRKKDLRLKEI